MEMSSSSLEDESSHVQDEGWRQVSSTLAVVTKNPAEATNFGPAAGTRELARQTCSHVVLHPGHGTDGHRLGAVGAGL